MPVLPILLRHSPNLFPMRSERHFEINTVVLTRTRRGLELGKVSDWRRSPNQENANAQATDQEFLGEILGIATRTDYKKQLELLEIARDLKWYLRARMRETKIPAKIIDIDITLDQKLLTILYSSSSYIDLHSVEPYITKYIKNPRMRINFSSIRLTRDREYNPMLMLGLCNHENCSSFLHTAAPDNRMKLIDEQQLGYDHDFFTGPCGMPWCSPWQPEDYEDIYIEPIRYF